MILILMDVVKCVGVFIVMVFCVFGEFDRFVNGIFECVF